MHAVALGTHGEDANCALVLLQNEEHNVLFSYFTGHFEEDEISKYNVKIMKQY